jgi:hypothetical protein
MLKFAQTMKRSATQTIQERALRGCRVYFLYVLTYAVSIIIFDSWNLITHDGILQRWTLAVILAVSTTFLWFIARTYSKSIAAINGVFYGLIIIGIIFAALNVYIDRGMASKSVILFAVPLVAAAITKSRSILLATASFSAAAYSLAMVRYFYENYGEGYRVQLYGEIFLYSMIFFVLAWLLLILIQPDKTKLS